MSTIPQYRTRRQNAIASVASASLGTVVAKVVIPNWGGHERCFTAVNATRHSELASKYPWNTQSCEVSAGRYSCNITHDEPGHGVNRRTRSCRDVTSVT